MHLNVRNRELHIKVTNEVSLPNLSLIQTVFKGISVKEKKNKNSKLNAEKYLLICQHHVVFLPVTWDTSMLFWDLSSKLSITDFCPKELICSKQMFVTDYLFIMAKYSLVICILFLIWYSGHTNTLLFLLIQRANSSWWNSL